MTEEVKKEVKEEVEEAELKLKTTDLISRAESAATRMENANAEAAKIVERNELIMSRALLGGKSEGVAPKPKTQEEIDQGEAEALAKAYFGR